MIWFLHDNWLCFIIISEEKVTNLNDIPEEGPITVVTNKDSHFETDLVIRCTGGLQPRNEAYVNTLGKINPNNFVILANHCNEVFHLQNRW